MAEADRRASRRPRRLPRRGPAAGLRRGRRDGEGPFTTDGVHFTDAGAEVVAAAFAAVIGELEAEDARPAAEEPA